LDGTAAFDEVERFTFGLAQVLVLRDPEHLTQEFLKADRGDRIFVDVGRNTYGATYAAPYAVRARPGAPVSAPCTWEELERNKVEPQTFTLRAMAERLTTSGDPCAGMDTHRRSLRNPMAHLKRLLGDHWVDDPGAGQAAARRDAMHAGHARWIAQRRTPYQ
jgi:bifunctional non-homologous end joining protein LigD